MRKYEYSFNQCHAERGASAFMNVTPLKTSGNLFYIRTQFVPRCKHYTSVIKTGLLMFYKAKVAVCSEFRTKHINAMWAPRRIF
jgi:hypothetical protein